MRFHTSDSAGPYWPLHPLLYMGSGVSLMHGSTVWQICSAGAMQCPLHISVLDHHGDMILHTSGTVYTDAMSWEDTKGGLTDDNMEWMLKGLGAGLMDEHKAQLAKLLCDNGDVFTLSLKLLGVACNTPHKIDTQGHVPIKCNPIHTSHAEMLIQYGEINKMHHVGVIQPSQLLWVFPVVLVCKKDSMT